MNTIMSKPCRTLAAFLLTGLVQAVFCCSQTFATSTDNFNDNSKDPTKWGTDIVLGNGVLTETNQRLQYTCVSPSFGDDSVDRPWILSRFPYNANWEMQIDTFNSTVPNTAFQVNSFGILILSPLTGADSISVELYASSLGGPPARNGFDTNLDTADVTVASADTGGLAVTNGAVRIAFDSATKVFTVFYDDDVSNGYQWVEYGSFGVAGAGGTTGNTDWGIADSGQFSALVYGFSQGMVVNSGQMFGDNFVETGGVVPAGPPSSVPTGSYRFAFPTNNPLLTAIASIIGNYQGLFPTTSFLGNRNYNLDVAQDETGKLDVMGSLEGIETASGPQLSLGVGEINTVSGEPTAQLNGSFTGTADGLSATANATALVPVEVVDIGGGTQGITGSFTHQKTVAGVPSSGSNMPFQAEAPPGSLDNLKKDWSLQLDITAKGKGKKQKLQVSAELVLPNGDTIVFPAKKAKFSNATGFATLAFKKGTNVTISPAKKDKLTTITITGLQFVLQGGVWQASAGTITYSFLGQQGTANLLDFETP